MPLTLLYDDQFLDHNPGWGHPENPGRLTAIVEGLRSHPIAPQLNWQTPTPPDQRDTLTWVETLHPPAYVNALRQLAAKGGGQVDADTVMSAGSYAAALLAVSAWLDGVDQVLATGDPAFVLARPPGHHAERTTGMGFCLFSNAAIAAHYALSQPTVNRVAILDWDVHHGNGTQALTEQNPQIAYCSLHQSPAYPGTGAAGERGFHQNVLNLPQSPGSTLADYEPVFQTQVMPFLRTFAPDLLIVSAGYDATHADPLASISLQPSDYGVFTRYCLGLGCPILFGLEGGYDHAALAQSVIATLEACLITVP
jgi:acetoin utilization deacetylase AcuC-like enzyme